MKPLDGRMMGLLARMPFLDRLEAAAISGWSRGAVYRSMGRLVGSGLVGSLPHATELTPLTRRYHLTARGLRLLASAGNKDMDKLLRSHPVSTRWRRVLLDRLDSLGVLYRLATALSNVAHPIGFRWYRAMPLDAAIDLPGGRTVGIFRLGPTSGRTGFAKRVWRLTRIPLPGTVLMLMPDEIRLRYARRLLSLTPVSALLALEREAALGATYHSVWQMPSVRGAIDLGAAMDRLPPGGVLPVERPLSRISFPRDLNKYGLEENVPDFLLPALLRPAEKRTLDLLSGWPWLNLNDLASLMGVSRPRASQVIASLEEFGLVIRTSASGGRLALSDTGLAMLARRDRTSVGIAKKRWSVSPLDGDCPLHWRNVAGRRSRQLLRHVDHTSAVHGFLAALAGQARDLEWGTVQLAPPIMASRYFRFLGGMRSIHPDAFGLLRKGNVDWPFFLEMERRAVRPITMAGRLAPYMNYYGTHRPADDQGSAPHVFVVFNEESAATGFLRVAMKEMEKNGVFVPLLVSHVRLVERRGPLGRVWRRPGQWEPMAPLPKARISRN